MSPGRPSGAHVAYTAMLCARAIRRRQRRPEGDGLAVAAVRCLVAQVSAATIGDVDVCIREPLGVVAGLFHDGAVIVFHDPEISFLGHPSMRDAHARPLPHSGRSDTPTVLWNGPLWMHRRHVRG